MKRVKKLPSDDIALLKLIVKDLNTDIKSIEKTLDYLQLKQKFSKIHLQHLIDNERFKFVKVKSRLVNQMDSRIDGLETAMKSLITLRDNYGLKIIKLRQA